MAMWFPVLHLGVSFLGLTQGIRSGSFAWITGGVGCLYLLPPLCYRLHQRFWPLREGRERIDEPVYSPWWTSLQLQGVFNALPWLEAILRLVPGAYSSWLRLWGSRVGRGVIWSPRVEIADRGLLEVGDGVIFGHRVALYAHVIDRRREGELVLFVKRIRVGRSAFLGAGSRIGPGAVIEDGARLPVLTIVSVNQRVEAEP